MSLGILKRFHEKKVQFFFRDFNFGPRFERLLLWAASDTILNLGQAAMDPERYQRLALDTLRHAPLFL